MATSILQPETINRLKHLANGAFGLLAGIKLDVFTPIKDGPLTAEQIADTIGVSIVKLRPLLYNLVLAGLLLVEDEHFSNTEEANHFLVKGSPSYMGARQELWSFFWEAALKTAESIGSGTPQAMHDWSSSPDETERWLRGIYGSALAAGRDLATRHDFSSCRDLLDVGGGSGGLSIAVTEAFPLVRATVVELHGVVPITRRLVDEAGAGDRVQVMAANAVSDSLTGAFDVAVMQRLIQVLSPDDARRVLRNVSGVIKPGGAIYIYGQVLEDSRLAPFEDAIENNITLINTTDGQAYTEQEYQSWLEEAGFEGFDVARSPTTCISARKAG